MKKITNKTKDYVILILCFIAILIFMILAIFCVTKALAANNEIISEYKNRPVILRAETKSDYVLRGLYGYDYCE